MRRNRIIVHPEVAAALRRSRAVVALESAVITTGLPRAPFAMPRESAIDGWDERTPANLAMARLLDQTVRERGAVPATVALLGGALHIGISDDQLVALANDTHAGKASTANLAGALARGLTAGTTIAATLTACHLTNVEPIRVFATGGIGGVHRHWQEHLDVSADLRALGTTPTCVVCAGAKSILDIPATLGTLEALGVPVVGWQSNHFAQFYHRGDGSVALDQRVDTVADAAALCVNHWFVLLRDTGVVLSNPIAREHALPTSESAAWLEASETEARKQSISGPALSPFLLGELARRSQGRSVAANVALLQSNAALAAQLAVELARMSV